MSNNSNNSGSSNSTNEFFLKGITVTHSNNDEIIDFNTTSPTSFTNNNNITTSITNNNNNNTNNTPYKNNFAAYNENDFKNLDKEVFTSISSSTTTTTSSSSQSSKSKRNSDSYEKKELNLWDLEGSGMGNNSGGNNQHGSSVSGFISGRNNNNLNISGGINKRNSLQLQPTNYQGTSSQLRSPYESPSKMVRTFSENMANSIKKSSTNSSSSNFSSNIKSTTATTTTTSAINNSGGHKFEASVPPSPHYTVRKNHDNQITQFPSTTPAKSLISNSFSTPLYGISSNNSSNGGSGHQYHDQLDLNQSIEPQHPVDTIFQDILENPDGRMSEIQLKTLLFDLFPNISENDILEMICRIPFEHDNYVSNSVIIALMQKQGEEEQQLLNDSMEDDSFENHPINNLTDYQNGKNSITNKSLIQPILQLQPSSQQQPSQQTPQQPIISPTHQYGDFEGISGTTGMTTTITGDISFQNEQFLKIQEELLSTKRELQSYKDNDKDIKAKNKRLEEEHAKLFLEIKIKEEENIKNKKELSNLKDSEKKRKELISELEEYKRKENESIKQIDEYKKQLTIARNNNKEEKQKVLASEKEKDEFVSKSVDLESKLKVMTNKYNALSQRSDEFYSQLMHLESLNATPVTTTPEPSLSTSQLISQPQQSQPNESPLTQSRNIYFQPGESTTAMLRHSQIPFDGRHLTQSTVTNDQHHIELVRKIEMLELEMANLSSINKSQIDTINSTTVSNNDKTLTISNLNLQLEHVQHQLQQQSQLQLIQNNEQQASIDQSQTLKVLEQNKSLKLIVSSKNEQIKQLKELNEENQMLLVNSSNNFSNAFDTVRSGLNNSNNNNNNQVDNDGEDDDTSNFIIEKQQQYTFSNRLFNTLTNAFSMFGFLVFIITASIVFLRIIYSKNSLLSDRPT